MKKTRTLVMTILIVLLGFTGCSSSGEQVGDSFESDGKICVTTLQYKWVWSLFGDSGYKLVPVTVCE